MSETDDTDVLLLIPPNFFLVYSSGSEDSVLESSRTVVHKPLSCTAQALGKLFNQVNSLESRLDSLEIDSNVSSISLRRKTWDTDSFDNRSLDRKCSTFPRRRRRKLGKRGKSIDVSLTSFESIISQKSVPVLNLRDKAETVNDSQSMDGDISSIVSTPSKKNDKLLLHEIDEFLNKVESYETPETKQKTEAISPENVIKAAGDYFTQKMDPKNSREDIRLPSGRTVSSDVLDKYIYLVRNKGSVTQTSQAETLPQSSAGRTENTTTNPSTANYTKDAKSPSMRRLNFFENRDVNPTSTPKRFTSTSYTDFKPTSNKIYDRASKVLEHYKSKNFSTQNSVTESDLTSLRKEEFKMPQMRPFEPDTREGLKLAAMPLDTIDTDLLSLSELWGDRGDRDKESIKLEEERLKREHCESMIQQLQRKSLEQQEKLAVAMKVDRAKDAAIAKLKDAWLKLTGNLDRAEERHRAALEAMVHEVDNFKTVAGEAQKKTNHFETELYKALDLAHDYQEKCKQLTAEKTELHENMDKAIANREEVIRSKEKEIEVLKESYDTVMRLNKQSTDCVKNLEDALEKERSDHEQTKSKMNDLNNKMQSVTDEMSLVQQEREILKDKVNDERARCNVLERQLADTQNQNSELLKKYDTLDTETKTLRKHLELQKTELKSHYQRQLEDAVLGKLQEFQRQLDLAERDMEAQARSKEAAIVDTYNKQMVRIEEQHKLEVNVLEEKQKEEIKLYRLQLAQANEKIGLLESKLETYRRRRGQIASQLHGVMQAQWRQALLILTHGHPGLARPAGSALDTGDGAATPLGQDYAPPKIPPLTMPPFAEKGLLRTEDRKPSEYRDFNFEGLSDNELQQYVKLLLTKPANFNLEESDPRQLDFEEPTSDRPDRNERRDRKRLNKPPWKA
ncbi:uncharacterized protein [Epargyreus clarus]|uniref:uncharacterized protein n=1 Tax=Epargyreus clarus TaxID=520877 RepID=UPI003C2D4654